MSIHSNALATLAKQGPHIVFDGEKLGVGDSNRHFVITPNVAFEVYDEKEQTLLLYFTPNCYSERNRVVISSHRDGKDYVSIQRLGATYECTVGLYWRSVGFLIGDEYESSRLAVLAAATTWDLPIVHV